MGEKERFLGPEEGRVDTKIPTKKFFKKIPGRREQREAEEKFELVSASVASEQHPKINQDAVMSREDKKMFGVFDGVGGGASGEVASRIAKETVEKEMEELEDNASAEETKEAMKKTLQRAHEAVLKKAGEGGARGMSTTAVVVKVLEGNKGEKKAIIGSVGDSRVYVFRENELKQITIDDNLIRARLKEDEKVRKVQEKLNDVVYEGDLNDEEQTMFRFRNTITQAVGAGIIKPNIYEINIKDGDVILVMTDGVSDNLADFEMANILGMARGAQDAVDNLIEASKRRSRDKSHIRHKPDDMSVVICGIGKHAFK